MSNLIIHHANCPDGFGAAWWLGKHLGDHVKHAASYDEPPPWFAIDADTDVYIVDFCYSREDTWAISNRCRMLTVLDHHQTAADHLLVDGFQGTNAQTAALLADHRPEVRSIVIDQSRSGVGLVSDYVRARWVAGSPRFLANIEDRDLWRFDLPETPAVFAAVTARPYTDAAWDGILDTVYADLVREGEAVAMYRDRLIEQVVASTFDVELAFRDGDRRHYVTVGCASSPYAIGSDVAGAIADNDESGIGAYCILHAGHVQIGLRSRGDGPDVAKIAESYGGGGHRHASGLRVDWEQWASMTTAVDFD